MNTIPQIFPDEPELNRRIMEKVLSLCDSLGDVLLSRLVPVKVRRKEYRNSTSFRRTDMAIYFFGPWNSGGEEEKRIVATRLTSPLDLSKVVELSSFWCDITRREMPTVLDWIEERGDLPANDWDESLS